jgi:hypothetical protein
MKDLCCSFNTLAVQAIPWQRMQYLGSACNTLPVHAIPWQCKQYLGSACNTLAVHAIPWGCMQFLGSACNTLAVHAITLAVHAIPWQLMQHLGIACILYLCLHRDLYGRSGITVCQEEFKNIFLILSKKNFKWISNVFSSYYWQLKPVSPPNNIILHLHTYISMV